MASLELRKKTLELKTGEPYRRATIATLATGVTLLGRILTGLGWGG
jgi:hypothetical protein